MSASLRNIEFVSMGRRLSGRLCKPPAPDIKGSALIFAHGLESSQEGYSGRAEKVSLELGCVCFTFDFSGHGRSSGDLATLTPQDHLNDLVSAFDLLVNNNYIDSSRIGVCGASYGAYLCALLTVERSVQRLLMRAPALYSDRFLDKPWAFPRSSDADADAPKLSAAVTGFLGDILILESENDEIIPHAVIQWYLRSDPRVRHEVLKGAFHGIATQAQEESFVTTISAFFRGM